MRAIARRSGSAMTEFAILLPVYVLLVIGLIFFANEILLWQEVQMSARFLSTNTRAAAAAPPGTPSPLIGITTGPLLPKDYFIYYSSGSGGIIVDEDNQPGQFTQDQIHEELVEAAWNVGQSFDATTGSTTTSQTYTRYGHVVYGNKPGLWEALPDQYSFAGDDLLIAQELSDWFRRRMAQVTVSYDSKYIRAGTWTLPSPSVTATAEAVTRERDTGKVRSLTASQSGYRKPIEDLLGRFDSAETPAGSLPLPHYPDFQGSDPFWVQN